MSDLITSLIRIAERRRLVDYECKDPRRHPAFISRPVKWLLDLDIEGNPIQLTQTSGKSAHNSKTGFLDSAGSKRLSVPNRYWLGGLNGQEPAFLLHGKLSDMFPKERPKTARDFKAWAAIETASHLACVKPVWEFLSSQKPLISEIKRHCMGVKADDNDVVSFRIDGMIVTQDIDLQKWWCAYFTDTQRRALVDQLPVGLDLLHDDRPVKLAVKAPQVFGRTPLASFSRRQFCSYGLGMATAGLSIDSAEHIAAAIEALRNDVTSCFSYDVNTTVFWATEEASNRELDCSFAASLNRSDPMTVRDFFRSTFSSVAIHPQGHFTAITLCNKQGRFQVRSSIECTLKDAIRNAERYFQAVEISSSSKYLPPLRAIAESLAPPIPKKAKKEAREKHASERTKDFTSLVEAAFNGSALPTSMLAQALTRQRIEISKGKSDDDKGEFESRLRARTALIKLYFKTNKDITMNEHEHENQKHPAYLCGRVLALLDKIHNAAHGKSTASSPAGRYYSSASSTPALVFPRLCKLTNIHLEKIGGGLAYKLQYGVPKDKSESPIERDFEGLAQLIARFSENTANAKWPRTLSLEDQGRFAIGFYYEKCRKWPSYRKGANPRGEESPEDENQDNETDNSDES